MKQPTDYPHDCTLLPSEVLPKSLADGPLAFESPSLTIVLPKPGLTLQEEAEWCLVRYQGTWHHVKFNNLARIYEIPGLYDRLLSEALHCRPSILICRELMERVATEAGAPDDLRVLDVGAGNGPVAEQLRLAGVRTIEGADCLPEARMAADRDRPGSYSRYYVEELERLSEERRIELHGYSFNCMTCITRLPGTCVSAMAFAAALSLLQDEAWVAFNLKEGPARSAEYSELTRFVETACREGILKVISQQRYQHRSTTTGKPVYYTAFIAKNMKSSP
jgi:hypothetical protein